MSRYAYHRASPDSGHKYVVHLPNSLSFGLSRTAGGWRAETLPGQQYTIGYGLTRELAVQDAVANVGKRQRRSNGVFGHVWSTMQPF